MTKKKVKTKSKFKFPEMTYNICQLAGCCGIGVACSFRDLEGETNWVTYDSKPAPLIYETKEEQVAAMYAKIIKDTWPEEGKERSYDDYYSYLQITLVSNYAEGTKSGTHQLPELEQLLLADDWVIQQVFINPNHGNEITVYSKYFPERNTDPYNYSDDVDYDDYE